MLLVDVLVDLAFGYAVARFYSLTWSGTAWAFSSLQVDG